jgi:hypothetical protein
MGLRLVKQAVPTIGSANHRQLSESVLCFVMTTVPARHVLEAAGKRYIEAVGAVMC